MMKKTFLFLTILSGALAAHADDYAYLTFERTDGTKASVAAEALTITVSGATLTAGTQTFTLTDLAKVYFTTADETSSTAIRSVSRQALTLDDATEIYDLQGRRVSREQMHSGIYVMKTSNGTFKVNVK